MNDSIETSEREAIAPTEAAIRAAGADTGPRITVAQVEAEILSECYFTAADAMGALGQALTISGPALAMVTICVLVLHNGHRIVGVNEGPVSAENFDAELGRKYARKHAVDQLWPLLGFRLRDRLLAQAHPGSA